MSGHRKYLTRRERMRRARSVRWYLARFVDLQDGDVRKYVRDQGTDPGEREMLRLRQAASELAELIRLMEAERRQAP